MANESSENGNTKGLGWIKNSIEQLNVKPQDTSCWME